MDVQTATDEVISKARGRKDAAGQSAVIKMEKLEKRIADLVTLHIKAAEAKEKLNIAVKATAESAGMLASVVNAFVAARAGDEEKFEEKKEKAAQLSLCFEEIGRHSGSRDGTL